MIQGYLIRSARTALVCAAVLALVIPCCAKKKEEAKQTPARQAETTPGVAIESYPAAPDVELKALDGSSVRLSSFPGKIIILSFLATWSADCRNQISALNDLQARLQRFNYAIIGVVTDDSASAVLRGFMAKNPVRFQMYYNGKEVAAKFGGMRTLPTTYFILRDGKSIYAKKRGYHSMYDLDEVVREMVRENL